LWPETFSSARQRKINLGCETTTWVNEMTNIAALPLVERVRQDAEPIATIYRNLGTAAAEQVVTRALAELGLAMGGLAQQVRLHDLADVSRRLRKVQRMAEHLGMVSLGTVADDARTCFDRNDVTAFSAVWARLIRVTERSLATDRNARDQSV
jgi:hypothetical protein